MEEVSETNIYFGNIHRKNVGAVLGMLIATLQSNHVIRVITVMDFAQDLDLITYFKSVMERRGV